MIQYIRCPNLGCRRRITQQYFRLLFDLNTSTTFPVAQLFEQIRKYLLHLTTAYRLPGYVTSRKFTQEDATHSFRVNASAVINKLLAPLESSW
jgi:hypothetical protein